MIDETLQQKKCALIGHEWETDQCGYLDHSWCIRCEESSTPKYYNELKKAFPYSKLSPVRRRRGEWDTFKNPDTKRQTIIQAYNQILKEMKTYPKWMQDHLKQVIEAHKRDR